MIGVRTVLASAAWLAASMALAQVPQDSVTEPAPLGSPADWFPADAYPSEAQRAGEEGTVRFAVEVDAGGRVTSCRITQSSGSPVLDAQTCVQLTNEGKFTPARDSAGKAIAGAWEGSTRWVLDDAQPIDLADGALTRTSTVTITLDEEGNSVDCTGVGQLAEMGDPCAHFVPGTPMAPPLRQAGVPVRGRLTMTMTSKIAPLPPEK